MRKYALVTFGLVVAILVALGLVVLFSASQPASRLELKRAAMREKGRLELALHEAKLRVAATTPEQRPAQLAEVQRLTARVEAAQEKAAQVQSPYHYWIRQILYCVLGTFLAVLVARFDYHHWKDWNLAPFLYVLEMVFLCAVFFFAARKGSQRWIPFGFFDLQPAELAKLVIVIVIAVWMDKLQWQVEKLKKGALIPAVLIGLMCAPIAKQPDYGSTMVVLAAGALIMFVAGTRWRYIIPLGVLGLVCVVALALANPNRRGRLIAQYGHVVGMQHIERVAEGATEAKPGNQKNDSYQIEQSIKAIRNGGLWGLGILDNGSMQKEYYLPENHTDFVFAVGAEELGLIRLTLPVIVLFALFFVLSVYIARTAADRLGRFIALGMGFVISAQAFFNLGVICDAVVTKGMALPFFSYGGTNMISAFLAVGTIFSVGIHSGQDKKRRLAPPRMNGGADHE